MPLVFVSLLLALLASGSTTLAAAPTAPLPAVIRSTLDREYPGWKFSPVTAQIQQQFIKYVVGHPPSMVAGDWDADGQTDYAVQIALTEPGKEEQIALAFLKRGDRYEEKILEARGLNPSVYLRVRKKKIPGDADDTPSLREMLVLMGTETGDTTYLFHGDRFEEQVEP